MPSAMHPLLLLLGFCLVLAWLGPALGRRLRAASRPVEASDLTDWHSEYEAERRKRFELVAIIADIQKERDQYKNLWWTCATEHSAAQHFMTEQYAALVKICRRNNLNPRDELRKMQSLATAYDLQHGEEKKLAIHERIESTRTPEHAAIEAGAIAVLPENV